MMPFKKVIRFFVFIGLFSFAFSCYNHSLEQEGPYWGKFSSTKNGEYWTGRPRGIQQDQLLTILADRYNQAGLLRESIAIRRIPMSPGDYKIPFTDTLNIHNTPTASYYTLQDDGDVIEGVYYVQPNVANFVSIQSINNGVYKGTFGITLIILPSRKAAYPYLPDTVKFSNGQFETKILIQ